MDTNGTARDLTDRLIDIQPTYALHHRVVYNSEALRMSAALAQRHPYLSNDPYETALDLLDEAGANVRTRRLAAEDETHTEVGLREIVSVASQKTGLSVDELLK